MENYLRINWLAGGMNFKQIMVTKANRKFLKIVVLVLSIFSSIYSNADEARGYMTTGVGSLEKCKKIGIQICDSKEVAIPTSIDSSAPEWIGVYHNTRKDGTSMCWLKLKNELFNVETLSFKCVPIR